MPTQYETGWEFDQSARSWRPPASQRGLQDDIYALISAVFPAGFINAFAGETAPSGWLLCDGQSVSKQNYPRLFSVLQYRHGGSGDSFNLPDLRGRVIVHRNAADASFDVLGEIGGAKTHTLTTAELPVHSHTVSSETPTTSTTSTNHAHNVYARDFWVGTMNVNWSHWHGGRIGNVKYLAGEQPHDHGGGAGWAAEASNRQTGTAASIPVNIDATDINHQHNGNHDHPSTNYQSEAPWAGNWQHSHTANHGHTGGNTGSGTAHNILQPYMVMNYVIKT